MYSTSEVNEEQVDLDFKEKVDAMTKEWLEKDGNVTCEFSTTGEDLDKKLKYLHEKGKDGVTWNVFYCETCKKHSDGKASFHVEIDQDSKLHHE